MGFNRILQGIGFSRTAPCIFAPEAVLIRYRQYEDTVLNDDMDEMSIESEKFK
jgi:hypothetical protein